MKMGGTEIQSITKGLVQKQHDPEGRPERVGMAEVLGRGF